MLQVFQTHDSVGAIEAAAMRRALRSCVRCPLLSDFYYSLVDVTTPTGAVSGSLLPPCQLSAALLQVMPDVVFESFILAALSTTSSGLIRRRAKS